MTPLARTKKFTYTRLKLLSRPVIVLPIIIFVVFIVLSSIAYGLSRGSLDANRDKVVQRRVQENVLELRSSLAAYKIIARGAAGFVESSGVSVGSWSTFVSAYDISSNFQAINAVTYAQRMSKDQAQAYVDERNQATDSNTFSLDPNKPAADPYIMTMYTEPNVPQFAKRLGLDEYAIESRKDAIDQAISTDKTTLTMQPQRILSSDDPNAAPQIGFIIFAPIYDTSKPIDTPDQRRVALTGTANVSFQAAKFFDTIYLDADNQAHTYLTIYQGPNEQSPKIYENGTHPAKGDTVPYLYHVQYANQTFTYAYEFSDSDLLTASERTRPIATLVAGISLGFLLALIMLFVIRSRYQRVASDKEHEVQVAKDELLSLASHQLRTPATGVKQYMGMVLQGFAGDITPQQKDFLQKAYDSNDRQLHIINDILHLAKLDSGRIVLSKTTFDMSELVRSVIDEQGDSASDAEVKLTRRLPKQMNIYADSHMMRMVVENLVSNAIKYTNPGGSASVVLKETPSSYTLSIKDTGVGIETNDLDKLFRQFSRVANERSHLVSGTGVGLYLVKNLVELHGGEISVVSKPAVGTTFSVVFPREDAPTE